YSSVGVGGALYKRAVSEPSHAGKVQSADGAWWEIAEDQIDTCALGADNSGASDSTQSIRDGISVGIALRLPVTASPGDYRIQSTINPQVDDDLVMDFP